LTERPQKQGLGPTGKKIAIDENSWI